MTWCHRMVRVPMLLGGASSRIADAHSMGNGCESRVRSVGGGQCHQDVPQCDDQGSSTGHQLHHGVPMVWKTM